MDSGKVAEQCASHGPGLHGAQSALHGLQSEYVFNYPVENIHATWTAALGRAFVMTNSVQIAERYQQTRLPGLERRADA